MNSLWPSQESTSSLAGGLHGTGVNTKLPKPRQFRRRNTNSAEWAAWKDDGLFESTLRCRPNARRNKIWKEAARAPRRTHALRPGVIERRDSAGDGIVLASPYPLVNEPTTTPTSRDTQSETTLTLGPLECCLCFNDSGQSASGKYTGFSAVIQWRRLMGRQRLLPRAQTEI